MIGVQNPTDDHLDEATRKLTPNQILDIQKELVEGMRKGNAGGYPALRKFLAELNKQMKINPAP